MYPSDEYLVLIDHLSATPPACLLASAEDATTVTEAELICEDAERPTEMLLWVGYYTLETFGCDRWLCLSRPAPVKHFEYLRVPPLSKRKATVPIAED